MLYLFFIGIAGYVQPLEVFKR